MLDIYEMKVFLAAAETGSFSEAGRRLQLSQPAISMQIRALEKNLGVELFYRAGRHINLSEIGQALVPLARDLVNHAAQVQETVNALQGEVIGALRIACNTTAGRYILPRLVARFVEKYPSVQVMCQAVEREAVLELVAAGDVQLGVSSLYEPSKELEFRPLTADPVTLIVPPGHDWALHRSIMLDELPDSRFIWHDIRTDMQQTLIENLTQHGVSIHDLPTAMVLCDTEAICIAVAEGAGAAFVSRRAAAEAIADGRVIEIPVIGLDMCEPLYMVRQAHNILGNVQKAFWEYVYSPRAQDILGC